MCDECKEKTKDRKALKLHRAPEVLLIMLKRTMYPSTEKDDRHITFPLEARPLSPAAIPCSSTDAEHPSFAAPMIGRVWRSGVCCWRGLPQPRPAPGAATAVPAAPDMLLPSFSSVIDAYVGMPRQWA